MRTVFLMLGGCFLLSLGAFSEPIIVPQPKEAVFGPAPFPVPDSVAIQRWYEEDGGSVALALEKALALMGSKEGEPGMPLILGTLSHPAGAQWAKSMGLQAPQRAEGYTLRVQSDGITVLGYDVRGLFYGIQTLRQLVEGRRGSQMVWPAVIRDYPALQHRGLHCFTGKNALVEQLQLIDFMAEHKYNYLTLQLEHMEFKRHPEFQNPSRTQPQEEIRQLIEYARKNLIEPIPVLPTLSHMEWLFYNGQNLHLAEDPEKPSNYCPTDPRTYELIFELFDEILALMEPKLFHLGHDEITMNNNFPKRESSMQYSVTELIDMDLDRLFSYFSGKGIGLALWSDMFLADGEFTDANNADNPRQAKERRRNLKRLWKKHDIPELIIYDWHYASAEPEQFLSVDLWKREGFKVIGAPWFSPDNIRSFTQKAVQENILGMEQTTWAGFNFSIEDNVANHDQFSAYLLAADYSWSGRKETADQLPYEYRRRFWNTWYAMKYGRSDRHLYLEDLSPEAIRKILVSNGETRLSKQEKTEDGKVVLTLMHRLSNPFGQAIRYEFDYTALPGGGRKAFPLSSAGEEAFTWQITVPEEDYRPSLDMTIPVGVVLPSGKRIEMQSVIQPAIFWQAGRKTGRIVIDGRLDEWQGAPFSVLADRKHVAIKSKWTPGDLSVRAWAGYDDRALYFAFEVTDDVHSNEEAFVKNLWMGDSVQIAIDFLNDKSREFGADDLEYGFALHQGVCQGRSFYPQGKKGKKVERVVEKAVRREGDKTFYEVRVPFDCLVDRGRVGNQIGFSFVVNDSDGGGFSGGLVATRGIYHQKDPGAFGILELR